MEQRNQQLSTYTGEEHVSDVHVHTLTSDNVLPELHRHNFFQIILWERGVADHAIDFREYAMTAGAVSVVFPRQMHRLKVSDDAHATVVMFDERVFCSEMLRNELKDYNIDLQQKINHLSLAGDGGTFAELLELVGQIRRLSADLNPVRKMQVKLMIKIMLLKIIDSHPDTGSQPVSENDTSLYIRFRERVDAAFQEQRKVNQYAEELGVSVKKLTAVCRHYCGLSPLEVIHEKLSLELKKVLALDDMTFKEIAFNFGFSSQSALNKYIEQKFGMTPLALKTRLKTVARPDDPETIL